MANNMPSPESMEGLFTDDEYKRLIGYIIRAYTEADALPVDEATITKIVRRFEMMKIDQLLLGLTFDMSVLPMWDDSEDDLVFVKPKTLVDESVTKLINVQPNLN